MSIEFPRTALTRLAFALILSSTGVQAADWPHWLGPNGDNIAPADGSFNPDLSGWKVAWKAAVGQGYSSVTVAGNHAHTLGHDGTSRETLYCFDANSGAVVWKHSYDAKLLPVMHPGGPNASPTVIGDRVITLSKDGQVFCLSTDRGDKLWQVNLIETGMALPRWGFASSPVVHAEQVIFCAGKAAALELSPGRPAWISKNAYSPGYATAVVFSREGKEFIAALDGKGLSILSARDGGEVVRRPFKAMFDMTATTPFVLAGGRRIFISNNTSAEMLGFDGQNLSPLWTSTEIKNAMNNSVILNGVIFGIDGRQQSPQSRLVSVNLETGKLNWVRNDFGYGTTIGIGQTVLSLTENGELVTFKPSREGYQEISRRQILGKLCWTPPVYANQRIYVRSDKGEVVCLSPP